MTVGWDHLLTAAASERTGMKEPCVGYSSSESIRAKAAMENPATRQGAKFGISVRVQANIIVCNNTDGDG